MNISGLVCHAASIPQKKAHARWAKVGAASMRLLIRAGCGGMFDAGYAVRLWRWRSCYASQTVCDVVAGLWPAYSARFVARVTALWYGFLTGCLFSSTGFVQFCPVGLLTGIVRRMAFACASTTSGRSLCGVEPQGGATCTCQRPSRCPLHIPGEGAVN